MTAFHITHLYPKDMSIYGDYGNILALHYRLKQYGFEMVYQPINPKDNLPSQSDLYFIGGGQDQEQITIFEDLLNKQEKIYDDIEDGIPFLAICGGYQLLGQKFYTSSGEIVEGLGVFDVETKALSPDVKERCVGNLIIQTTIKELIEIKLVGFENHSGQTRFISDEKCQPLGKVIYGYGNNISRKYEGCVYKNAIGTYLHGPCLPKNPELADWLIIQALETKTKKGNLKKGVVQRIKNTKLKDEIALLAKKEIIDKFAPGAK